MVAHSYIFDVISRAFPKKRWLKNWRRMVKNTSTPKTAFQLRMSQVLQRILLTSSRYGSQTQSLAIRLHRFYQNNAVVSCVYAYFRNIGKTTKVARLFALIIIKHAHFRVYFPELQRMLSKRYLLLLRRLSLWETLSTTDIDIEQRLDYLKLYSPSSCIEAA